MKRYAPWFDGERTWYVWDRAYHKALDGCGYIMEEDCLAACDGWNKDTAPIDDLPETPVKVYGPDDEAVDRLVVHQDPLLALRLSIDLWRFLAADPERVKSEFHPVYGLPCLCPLCAIGIRDCGQCPMYQRWPTDTHTGPGLAPTCLDSTAYAQWADLRPSDGGRRGMEGARRLVQAFQERHAELLRERRAAQ